MYGSLMALAATLVSAAPLTPTPSRTLERRGGSSCTFTSAASASASAGDCSVVTLRNIAVPAGESLELNNLKAGTQVRFLAYTTHACYIDIHIYVCVCMYIRLIADS